jgi:hypothetical protein
MDRLSKLKSVVKETEETNEPSTEVHWSTFLAPLDETPKDTKDKEPSSDLVVTNNVDDLIPLALDVHYKIMKNTELDPDADDYIAKANLVLKTAQSVLTTQIKVDENILRRKKQDDVFTILQELRDEEKKQLLRGQLVAAE